MTLEGMRVIIQSNSHRNATQQAGDDLEPGVQFTAVVTSVHGKTTLPSTSCCSCCSLTNRSPCHCGEYREPSPSSLLMS